MLNGIKPSLIWHDFKQSRLCLRYYETKLPRTHKNQQVCFLRQPITCKLFYHTAEKEHEIFRAVKIGTVSPHY